MNMIKRIKRHFELRGVAECNHLYSELPKLVKSREAFTYLHLKGVTTGFGYLVKINNVIALYYSNITEKWYRVVDISWKGFMSTQEYLGACINDDYNQIAHKALTNDILKGKI